MPTKPHVSAPAKPDTLGPTCSSCAEGFKQTSTSPLKCTACDMTTVKADNAGSECAFYSGFLADSSGCYCKCLEGYAGRLCDACAPGYVGYPSCARPSCSIATDCSGHASAVSVAADNSCVCTCIDQWAGSKCHLCPAQYDQTTCNKCAPRRINYPVCTECTCNGLADVITTDSAQTQCVCQCKAGISCRNPPCSTCDMCDTSRGFYQVTPLPNLTCAQCSVVTHCNNHAVSVSVNSAGTGCVCQCAEGYTGATCDRCTSSALQYPYCQPCTISGSCYGHATAVRPITGAGGASGCECTCRNQWTGPQCETCPPEYDEAQDCGTCAPGYIHIGTTSACTSCATVCGPSVTFSSSTDRKTCICGCICNSTSCFVGDRCEKCADGFTNYPTCEPCTPAVAGCDPARTLSTYTDSAGACRCTCLPTYDGPKCDRCATGYHMFPTCVPCTLDSCGGPVHAVRAFTVLESNASVCKCECRPGWTGATCATCRTGFDPAKNCLACAPGHFGYPDCLQCNASYCFSHGTASTSPDGSSCLCACVTSYGGSRCDQCADGYVVLSGAPGTASLLCRPCDPTDCSNASTFVTSNADHTDCVCTCKEGRAGARCETCAPGYYADTSGGSLVCRKCTQADCNFHADIVTTTPTGCLCTCKFPWTGPQCQTCPSPNANAACTQCLPGYDNFPLCDRCALGYVIISTSPLVCAQCNISSCSGRALRVTSSADRSTCVCECTPPYTGPTCASCLPGWRLVGTDCVQCTIQSDCSGNAMAVSSDPATQACVCLCKPGFTGPRCDTCAPGHVPPSCQPCTTAVCHSRAHSAVVVGTNCSCLGRCFTGYDGEFCERCADGYIGWPNCVQCTVPTHCHNNALNVTSNSDHTKCTCTCAPGFRPETACADCLDGLPPVGGSCQPCPDGFTGRQPNCRPCAVDLDCSGHASAVTGTGGQCTCTCAQGFAGARCDQCDTARGYTDYPSCRQCSIEADCSGRAVSVTPKPDGLGCACTCRAPWFGSDCSQCVSSACPPCGDGAVGIPPLCTPCTNTGHCNGLALSVTANTTTNVCVCTCPSTHTGTACEQCAAGLFGWPTCAPCTSAAQCHNLGTATLLSDTQCTCSCPPQYTGDHCQQCAQGRIDWPRCALLSEVTQNVTGSGTVTRTMALVSCLGTSPTAIALIRNTLLAIVNQPGASVAFTTAPIPIPAAGQGCYKHTFLVHSLGPGTSTQAEAAIQTAVDTDPTVRSQLNLSGTLEFPPAPSPPSAPQAVPAPSGSSGLFGTTWLTPPVLAAMIASAVGIVVVGTVISIGVVVAFLRAGSASKGF